MLNLDWLSGLVSANDVVATVNIEDVASGLPIGWVYELTVFALEVIIELDVTIEVGNVSTQTPGGILWPGT